MKDSSKLFNIAFLFLSFFLMSFILLNPSALNDAMHSPVLVAIAAMIAAALGTKIASDYLKARFRLLKEKEDEAQKRRNEDDTGVFENLELGDIQNQLKQIKELISKIGENELQEISAQLRESLMEGATEELVTELRRKIASDDQLRRTRISIKSAFDASEERLSNEVEILRTRANTNMLIGCFIALFGAGILALSMYLSNSTSTKFDELIVQMVPRFSIVVLIELFAYFFLSMYRSNLSEIRYYQNEITNIEMRKAGTLLSISGTPIDTVTNELIATDRNGVLTGNQTTQELERLKIERASMKSTLDTLTTFFKK